jgi:hypothetical protein
MDDGPMRKARPGGEVSTLKREPPWLVVSHDLSKAVLAHWPGRLWAAEIVEAVEARDQPLPYATYTRAWRVRILEEEPASRLFGPAGTAICSILDVALGLDREMASRLANARHAEAERVYSDAWQLWLRHLGYPAADQECEFERVLGLTDGRPNPGAQALITAYNTVFTRAQQVDPDHATSHDVEDIWLLSPWDDASAALIEAVMAAAVREVIPDYAYAVLTEAWRAVIGPMPA